MVVQVPPKTDVQEVQPPRLQSWRLRSWAQQFSAWRFWVRRPEFCRRASRLRGLRVATAGRVRREGRVRNRGRLFRFAAASAPSRRTAAGSCGCGRRLLGVAILCNRVTFAPACRFGWRRSVARRVRRGMRFLLVDWPWRGTARCGRFMTRVPAFLPSITGSFWLRDASARRTASSSAKATRRRRMTTALPTLRRLRWPAMAERSYSRSITPHRGASPLVARSGSSALQARPVCSQSVAIDWQLRR